MIGVYFFVAAAAVMLAGAVFTYSSKETNKIDDFIETVNRTQAESKKALAESKETKDQLTANYQDLQAKLGVVADKCSDLVTQQMQNVYVDIRKMKTETDILNSHYHSIKHAMKPRELNLNIKQQVPIEVVNPQSLVSPPVKAKGKDSLLKRSGIR